MFKQILINLLLLICLSFSTNAKDTFTNDNTQNNGAIQRVRLDVTTPTGYVRHLLLGFTPDNSATDGFDYGYDAYNVDNYPDDFSWMIGEDRFVTQGVGAFDETKTYPLGVFLSTSGIFEIELMSLENFNEAISVYIYDAFLNTYTLINDINFSQDIVSGEFTDRFYITFIDNTNENNIFLSTPENQLENTSISYSNATNLLNINTNSTVEINQVELYDLSGRRIYNLEGNHTKSLSIKINIQSQYYIIRLFSGNIHSTRKLSIIR